MPPRAPRPRLPLAEVMALLEAAGTEQTRKTYRRHGAVGPLFGVSFATFKALVKRIGVDQELAVGLWDSGVLDARILAVKVADAAQMTPSLLDAWAAVPLGRPCVSYVAMLAAEGPHALGRAEAWLASPVEALRCNGWTLVGAVATRDESLPDTWFEARIQEIEGVKGAPNQRREAMMEALTAIGCRNAALRVQALGAAGRIGHVDIDMGDTACKVPVVADTVAKAWAHSLSKGHMSPAAHERTREPMRTRC